MTTLMHLVVDVALALEAGDLAHFQNTAGRPLSRDEAAGRAREALAAGINFLPVGDCPTFDPKTGCPGHEVQ